VVVVLLLAVVVDRAAVSYADRQVAVAIRNGEALSTSPDVSIHGFPFLTQFLRGRYGRVDVSVQGLTKGGLTIDHVDAHLHGVQVGFWDVVHQRLHTVRIDRIDGSVLVSYPELATAVGHGVAYSYMRPGVVRVAAGSGGTPVEARVGLRGGAIVIVPVSGALGSADLALPRLPFQLQLESVSVTPQGVRVAARAHSVTVQVAHVG
jgi:hypothetical protein